MIDHYAARLARLEALIDRHPNTPVSFNDSLLSGNCRAGSEAFMMAHFPGRFGGTLAELKPHLRNETLGQNVAHLVLYKVRQLEGGERLPEFVSEL